MAIEVETKDCTQLGDGELAEMADLCADGPEPLRVRPAVEDGRGVGAHHPGPRGRQAQGLLVLHARAHRRHAVRPDRSGVGRPHREARRRAQGADDRPVPPGRARLPRRGRPRRHPLRRRRRLRGVPQPRGHRAPARPQGHRRGAGLGPAPGQAVRRSTPTTTAPSSPPATAPTPPASTTRPSSPRAIDAEVAKLFGDVDSRARRHLIAFGWAMAEFLAKHQCARRRPSTVSRPIGGAWPVGTDSVLVGASAPGHPGTCSAAHGPSGSAVTCTTAGWPGVPACPSTAALDRVLDAGRRAGGRQHRRGAGVRRARRARPRTGTSPCRPGLGGTAFAWPGLLAAPVLVVVCVRPGGVGRALRRGRQGPGGHAGLGARRLAPAVLVGRRRHRRSRRCSWRPGPRASAPACSACSSGRPRCSTALGVPDGWRGVGVVALGHPDPAGDPRARAGPRPAPAHPSTRSSTAERLVTPSHPAKRDL